MTSDAPTEIDLLAKLVSFNTVSSRSNLDLIHFIRDYLAQYGVQSELIFDATGQKANLFATIGDGRRPGIVLSGHTDVVPVDGQEWTRDPFSLTQEGDRLYGRGTTDMKGFIACVLASVPRTVSTSLAIPLHLAFSYDEEVGCLGVHGLVEHMERHVAKPIAALVGEPTMMSIVDGHKGSCGLLTEVEGLACHSSRVDQGVNAIFYATDIISEIRRCADELMNAPEAGSRFELPFSSVSVGVIHGGTARNAVPGDCAFQWDIRATRPGVTDQVQERVSAFIESDVLPKMRERYPDARVTTTVAYDVPPLVPDAGSTAETLAKRFAGRNDTSTVNYGSEAGIFQAAGVPSVLCGPGRDSEAHITDEWVSADQLRQCMAFLDKLVAYAEQA